MGGHRSRTAARPSPSRTPPPAASRSCRGGRHDGPPLPWEAARRSPSRPFVPEPPDPGRKGNPDALHPHAGVPDAAAVAQLRCGGPGAPGDTAARLSAGSPPVLPPNTTARSIAAHDRTAGRPGPPRCSARSRSDDDPWAPLRSAPPATRCWTPGSGAPILGKGPDHRGVKPLVRYSSRQRVQPPSGHFLVAGPFYQLRGNGAASESSPGEESEPPGSGAGGEPDPAPSLAGCPTPARSATNSPATWRSEPESSGFWKPFTRSRWLSSTRTIVSRRESPSMS